MVALKPREAERLAQKPDTSAGIVLVFGQDEGLIVELAGKIAKAVAAGDDLALIRLEAAQIMADPGSLADAVMSIPMFGGRRAIWLRDGGTRALHPLIEPLMGKIPRDTLLVIEAGDLKKGTGLRKLIEDDRQAIAVVCYADDDQTIAALAQEEARAHGLSIDRDAVQMLEGLLGGDRMATRGEIRKLCLYALKNGTIRVDDVEAVIGDVSGFAMDELVDAVALGDLDAVDRALRRLVSDGSHLPVAVGAVARHFQALARGRAAVDEGRRAAEVVERMAPPIFWKRKDAVARQLSLWPQARIDRALARLDAALLATRRTPSLQEAIVSEALLSIAGAVKAK
jgi:DNA polymerase-3 subunit delta